MKNKLLFLSLISSVGVFLSEAGVTLANEEYSLTIIEDEQTALAAGVPHGSSLYYITVGILVITLILFVIGVYLLECARYRKRAIGLGRRIGKEKVDINWNLFRLKETVKDLESSFIEDCS